MPADLTPRDLDALSDVAHRMLEVASVDELRRYTVESIAGLSGSPLVAWNEVRPDTGWIEAVTSPGIESRRLQDLTPAFAAGVGDHPVIAHHRRTGDGRPHAISDFTTSGEFHDTGLYCDFYRPLGAEDQLSFIVPHHKLIIGVALNQDRPGVPERNRRICQLLRPVICQTYRVVAASSGEVRSEELVERFGLSRREGQVLALALSGLPNKRIASCLAISARTVEKHLERAFKRLGVRSRMEAAALARPGFP